MSGLAVITALYDGYDTLKPTCPQDVDVEWICVTDDETLADDEIGGWQIIYAPRPGVHPNRAAKVPKLWPWQYTQATASVWIDASFQVTSHSFVREALELADPIAQFIHPWRDCIYDEAIETMQIEHKAKYGAQRYAVIAQVAAARAIGHPEHWGLWATGVIARRHTSDVVRLSHRWGYLIDAYSYQDQISQAVALRGLGMRPKLLGGTHFANPWVEYRDSHRHHVG